MLATERQAVGFPRLVLVHQFAHCGNIFAISASFSFRIVVHSHRILHIDKRLRAREILAF